MLLVLVAMVTNPLVPLLAPVPAVVLLQDHRRCLHLLELAAVHPSTYHPLDKYDTPAQFTLTDLFQQLVVCILWGWEGVGGVRGLSFI